MNHNQKVYALKRIDELRKTKEYKAKEKYEVESKHISIEERYKLVKSGKVSLLPLSEIDLYTYFKNAYDFSNYEHDSYIKPEYEVIMKQVNSMATRAKDQIMLGDCEEALKLINELDALNV